MSATVEINALSTGSGSGKYEVNSNVVSDLSAAGDCSAGTPGKYRPLRVQQPACTAAGDPLCSEQESLKITDKNANQDAASDQKSDIQSKDQEQPSLSGDSEFKSRNLEGERGNLIENGNNIDLGDGSKSSAEDLELDSCVCQDANNLEKSYISSKSDHRDGGDFDSEDKAPKAFEDSVATEANKQDHSMYNNSSSPQEEEQEEVGAVKQKSKKKGGLLHLHLPKFGMKRGHGAKGGEGSTSSDPESSPEKHSKKTRKRDKHRKQEEDEDGDAAKVHVANEEDAAVEESCQIPDFEQDKHDKGDFDKDPKEMQGSGHDENIDVAIVTENTVARVVASPAEKQPDQMDMRPEEDAAGQHTGHTADPEPKEEIFNTEDAVAKVTGKDRDEEGAKCGDAAKITSGPTDNEPSSIPSSSLASGDDFYTLPQSSLGSSTDPCNSEISDGQREDSSTTRQGDSSTLGGDDSNLDTETSLGTYRETVDMPSKVVEDSAKTDELLQRPNVIPDDVLDSEQNLEGSVLSSSNQSSFDTDSPSLTGTPELSPKKKSKRRVPLLNVTLPSFGKRHHRLVKSPEQSSDSDRPSSPSKKFSWKKKNPKKAAVSPTSLSCGSTEEKILKDADAGKIEALGAEEKNHSSKEEAQVDFKMDNTSCLPGVPSMTVDHPERRGDDRVVLPSDEKVATGVVSCEIEDAGQEGGPPEHDGEEDPQDPRSDDEEETRGTSNEVQAGDGNEVKTQAVEELQEEELVGEMETSTNVRAEPLLTLSGLQDHSYGESPELASDGREDAKDMQEEDLQRDDEQTGLPEDDTADAQDEESIAVPTGLNLKGNIEMSASLEVNVSSTHHVSSPSDFILTTESFEVGEAVEEDAKVRSPLQDGVTGELAAPEKILAECNQLVADDSVGDVQFTPEMLSEFTKTIDAFEEEEDRDAQLDAGEAKGLTVDARDETERDSQKDVGKVEGLKLDTGGDEEALNVEAEGHFEVCLSDPLANDMESGPVDVGCQMTWENDGDENEDHQKVVGIDGNSVITLDLKCKQEVSEDDDKRSISSSMSSSSSESSAKGTSGEIVIQGVASIEDEATPNIKIQAATQPSEVVEVEDITKVPDAEGLSAPAVGPRSVQLSVGELLPGPDDSTSVEVPSSTVPEIQLHLKELSSDSDAEGEKRIQVVMNEEGSVDTTEEVPSKPVPEVKQKTKSKGFFSGFNFHLPRFRGKRSGKLDVATKSNQPSVGEGKISFSIDKERETCDKIQAESSRVSKASSELDISRRRSAAGYDECVLDNRAPSVPDVSQRELELKRSKKKSFTLPNMHLHLPRFSGKKSPKSPSADKVIFPSAEVTAKPPAIEGNPALEDEVQIEASTCISPVKSCEAEILAENDLEVKMSSTCSQEIAIPEVQHSSFGAVEVEALTALDGIADFSGKEVSIDVSTACGKPQVDGLFVAVPAFVEGDSDLDEGVPSLSSEEIKPAVTANLEANLEADDNSKLQAWGLDVNVPSVVGIQPEVEAKPETNSATRDQDGSPEAKANIPVHVDGNIDVIQTESPAVHSEKADISVGPGVSLSSGGMTEVEVDPPCNDKNDVEVDGEKVEDLQSPIDVNLCLSGSCSADVPVDDDFKSDLPEVAGVKVEGDVMMEEGSDGTLDLKAVGEGEAVDVELSAGLELSAGSRDASLENQVKTADLSTEVEGMIPDMSHRQSKSPDPVNSPTRHRFKLSHLNFSLPKFGGLHPATKKSSSKKSKTVAPPSNEACGVECGVASDDDEQERGFQQVSVIATNDSVEVVPQPVLESELKASFVKPEEDIGVDLEMRFGGLAGKGEDPINTAKDDVRAKLDFDDEIPPEFSANANELEQDCSLSGLHDLGVRLADISFGAQVSPSYPNGDADKDLCECRAGTPSQEDPASSLDLNWEDEVCPKVQVTVPKYRFTDIKGGLSLGVVVSEDGSTHSDTEEKIPRDEEKEAADDTVMYTPKVPDMAMKSAEEHNLEMTSASPQPEALDVNISVETPSAHRKQSTSSHSSAKSASSHNSQTNAGELSKKKGGLLTSLGLPKLHLKLSPQRSKSLDRRAVELEHPVEPRATSPTDPEAGAHAKKPVGKKSKKGRWKLGKSSSKGKHRTRSGGSAERLGTETEKRPLKACKIDIDGNLEGTAEADIYGQPSFELNPQPSTSAGPAASTPVKPALSLNNSSNLAPATPTSTNSLCMEQAVAIHSSPGSPVAPSLAPRRPFGVVVAIDFGTTFSGYAYSFCQEPDDIQIMRKWEGGDPGVTNMKTPTTLLLWPDGEFHSFGFTARDSYHDMDHNEALRWLYFDKFKLALHKDPNLNLETELTAANGQRLPAIKVFEHALRFFREHAVEELCDQSNDGRFDPGEIRWVLTVPAIWKQPAKQFMREAAYRAGLASPSFPEQLLIALEPEAASICIRKLRMRELVPEHLSQRRKWMRDNPEKSNSQVAENIRHGTRYMVVDCGGGTVDITVHEVEEDEGGSLKELHKASGGMYGSVCVDAEFEKLLVEIFGEDFIEEFKIKRPAGWVDLMIAFESRKRNVNPYKNNPLNVSLPFSFIDYYKKYTRETSTVEDAIWNYRSQNVTWSAQGMLRFTPEGMQQLFRPAVASIISLVEGLLNEPQLKGVSYLFLAGGFAQSPLLQNQMRKKFASRLRVIIPRDVGLTILKGAVMFGLDPTAVRVRRSRLTYGVGVLNKFVPARHPREKQVVKDKVEWCKDIFDTYVQADQSVAVGDMVTRSYTPAKPSQKAIVINIYCTERDKVDFITDRGVHKCGTLHIDVSDAPPSGASPAKRRELQLTMQFGDTEIKVSALDVPTGKCVKANIDFLSK
ncbi:uncharacterized protein LOC110973860 isoform X2 [Acanthaster planci]|uniref:Uncharacterized protein LOC110973860 isoform X2 n=1 Tax=Acanthaster planci TaxID=133434 RepID=A0A8B7XL89_ACAPL|nr:uncharacterized protein LOC110973860 isoform X2 [Acanthaster planci]